jgi:C1A family cysteine protease
MAYKERGFGWLPDLPDQRDHLFSVSAEFLQSAPAQVDLRKSYKFPAVYDQGQLGSCTANAIAGALQFDELKQKKASPFQPSRLFIYYNERAIENTVSSDSGARIRDGIKSVASTGYCPETEWPYDIAKFAQQPAASCYQDAKKYQAVKYQRVIQLLGQMKGCLAGGSPFVAGFSVYQSIRNSDVTKTGNIPLPRLGESLLGGHAILIIGYDDSKGVFILRNSWGDGWGSGGYGTIPYIYLATPFLASDFWVVNTVS